jgi:hypothetical protein
MFSAAAICRTYRHRFSRIRASTRQMLPSYMGKRGLTERGSGLGCRATSRNVFPAHNMFSMYDNNTRRRCVSVLLYVWRQHITLLTFVHVQISSLGAFQVWISRVHTRTITFLSLFEEVLVPPQHWQVQHIASTRECLPRLLPLCTFNFGTPYERNRCNSHFWKCSRYWSYCYIYDVSLDTRQ